jgi:cytochrome c-type biogenesis protein CcmH/NrfG
MQNKHLAFGIVGVLIGFVTGFFLNEALRYDALEGPPPQSQARPSTGSELPQDHPTAQVVEKLRSMQEEAQAHPENYELRVILGNTYYDMSRFDSAIRWYEEALALNSENPNVTTDLGTAYFYTDRPDRAIELFHQSLKLEKDHPQTLQNLGWVQFTSDRTEEAIWAWERLVALHPNYQHIESIEKHLDEARARLKGEST